MIKKGDLVMVVKPTACCGGIARLGQVFKVMDRQMKETVKCTTCGDIDLTKNGYVPVADNVALLASRLKKIDPPATGELDGVPQRLREPA